MSQEIEDDSVDPARDAEEHFSQLVNSVQDYAIFMLSPTGHVKSWNEGAKRIKGYTADEIVGKHFSQFYPPAALARNWPDEELRLAALEGRFEDEGWRLRKDGSQFWANVVLTPLRNTDGSLRGFLKITRDLTEGKKAEEALRQSEQRYRLLVEGVKDYAIFRLDADGRIATWNSGAERIKGYTTDEIVGQHFSVFYTSEDVASDKPARELEVAQKEGRVEDEGWRVRKDRSLFWANVVITPLYDDSKQLLGYAKITRDMSDKRKNEDLQLADRQKNEFLAMLAHELRNPLAPISNGLQLLKLPGIDNATIKVTTELMERQMFHLIRLIDDLMDVSRVITGKLTFQKESADLAAVIHHAVEETQGAIDARGHELMLSLPGRAIILDADPQRLSQVISNLLVNAAKYTEKPSQIWLSVERHDYQAVIRVRDNGVGIHPEVLPKIFNLFVQADNSLARSQGGLGIGLTVVKRIIDMHGGTVSAFSAGIGQGSEFTIRLPISKAIAAATKGLPLSKLGQGGKRRILVVDDNVDAAMTIASLLKAWGHEVQTAFNGHVALELVQTFTPEIVLLDIGMPGMTGYDVARRLRSDPTTQGTVIAALTGYGQESDRQRSFDAGFDYHFTKPPDPTLLESLLATPKNRAAI